MTNNHLPHVKYPQIKKYEINLALALNTPLLGDNTEELGEFEFITDQLISKYLPIHYLLNLYKEKNEAFRRFCIAWAHANIGDDSFFKDVTDLIENELINEEDNVCPFCYGQGFSMPWACFYILISENRLEELLEYIELLGHLTCEPQDMYEQTIAVYRSVVGLSYYGDTQHFECLTTNFSQQVKGEYH